MDDNSPNESEGEQADSSRPTTRLPTYKRGDEVIAWMEVDAEWWEHVQHAREVHKEVVATCIDEPGVNYIERGQGDETIAGHSTEAINILVADKATAERLDFPDEIDGIPLIVEVGHIVDTK